MTPEQELTAIKEGRFEEVLRDRVKLERERCLAVARHHQDKHEDTSSEAECCGEIIGGILDGDDPRYAITVPRPSYEQLEAALAALADGAEQVHKDLAVIQPFLGIYKKYGKVIAEAQRASTVRKAKAKS